MATASATITANVLAARLTRDLKRPITAKAVRSWARANMPAHDKVKHPEYQAHLYTAADVARITAGFKARSATARVQAEAKSVKRSVKPTVKPTVKRSVKPTVKPDTIVMPGKATLPVIE